jgi:hypothetical protein
MARPAQIDAEPDNLMIDHVSGLITEASQLHEWAVERAAAGDRAAAADSFKRAALLASIALSFRYELADAYADTSDADCLITVLDNWDAMLGRDHIEPEVGPVFGDMAE